jgi:hypothetical protein
MTLRDALFEHAVEMIQYMQWCDVVMKSFEETVPGRVPPNFISFSSISLFLNACPRLDGFPSSSKQGMGRLYNSSLETIFTVVRAVSWPAAII